MLVSITVNYLGGLLAGLKTHPKLRRAGTWGAVIIGLGLLGWFKYAAFGAEILNSLGCLLPLPEITPPSASPSSPSRAELRDRRRPGPGGGTEEPARVALYICCSQLVAGPIVRYTTVAEEIVSRGKT